MTERKIETHGRKFVPTSPSVNRFEGARTILPENNLKTYPLIIKMFIKFFLYKKHLLKDGTKFDIRFPNKRRKSMMFFSKKLYLYHFSPTNKNETPV